MIGQSGTSLVKDAQGLQNENAIRDESFQTVGWQEFLVQKQANLVW